MTLWLDSIGLLLDSVGAIICADCPCDSPVWCAGMNCYIPRRLTFTIINEPGDFCACGDAEEVLLTYDGISGFWLGTATICGETGNFRFSCGSQTIGLDVEWELWISNDDFATHDNLSGSIDSCDPFVISGGWAHLGFIFLTCNTAHFTITEAP